METNKPFLTEEDAEIYFASLTKPLADEKGLVITAYCVAAEKANARIAEQQAKIEQLESIRQNLLESKELQKEAFEKERIDLIMFAIHDVIPHRKTSFDEASSILKQFLNK